MHGASIYFRSARLEAAVGTRQRSGPTAILLSAAKRRPDYARAGTVTLGKEKEKKKKKERTRFPVTGGISCLTDRRDSETNDARLLRHDESHLGTAGRQTSRSIPKFVTRRGNSPPSSLIYCGLDD